MNKQPSFRDTKDPLVILEMAWQTAVDQSKDFEANIIREAIDSIESNRFYIKLYGNPNSGYDEV